MRILITGSSGFIGSHLHRIFPKAHALVSDLRDHSSVKQEVVEYNPEIIVHLAARTEVEKSFYEQNTFSEINYVGTVNLVEAAAQTPNLKNFVFASTMEVYGWQPISDQVEQNGFPDKPLVFDENTIPNPNAPYAVAKYACEKYLEYAHRCYGLPCTIIRQTNSYGRLDNDFFVTEQIITQMIKQKTVKLGYSEPYRNFLYISDLMNAWQAVIENSRRCNDASIFTLGPNDPHKISDYANMIGDMIGFKGEIQWNTKPKRPGEIYWLNSDCKLINNRLGWYPEVSIEDGLDKTISHWRSVIN